MKFTVALTTALSFLGGIAMVGRAQLPKSDAATQSPQTTPSAEATPQVRELAFDIDKLEYQKKHGRRLEFCTTRAQLEPELGARVAAQVWGQIDAAKEAVVILGYPDTFVP